MSSIDPPVGYFDLAGIRAKFFHIEDGNYWKVHTDDRVVAVLSRDERGWFKHGEASRDRFDDPELLARLIESGTR